MSNWSTVAVYTPSSSIPELKQKRNKTLVGSTGAEEDEEDVDVNEGR
jgi:hypothetical protein